MITFPIAGGKFGMVDDCDVGLVVGYAWCLDRWGYVHRTRRASEPERPRKHVLHRLVMRAASGSAVDHVDRNPLNNTRANLRFATPAQQACNRGKARTNKVGYKGVCCRRVKFEAKIRQHGKQIYLGVFKHAQEAALAYGAAAREIFGSFAVCNYPDES